MSEFLRNDFVRVLQLPIHMHGDMSLYSARLPLALPSPPFCLPLFIFPPSMFSSCLPYLVAGGEGIVDLRFKARQILQEIGSR